MATKPPPPTQRKTPAMKSLAPSRSEDYKNLPKLPVCFDATASDFGKPKASDFESPATTPSTNAATATKKTAATTTPTNAATAAKKTAATTTPTNAAAATKKTTATTTPTNAATAAKKTEERGSSAQDPLYIDSSDDDAGDEGGSVGFSLFVVGAAAPTVNQNNFMGDIDLTRWVKRC